MTRDGLGALVGVLLLLLSSQARHRPAVGARVLQLEQDYLPGSVNLLGPEDRHRIELLGADCWTLFLVGPYAQPWAFHPVCR
jgi:hypothetical protein